MDYGHRLKTIQIKKESFLSVYINENSSTPRHDGDGDHWAAGGRAGHVLEVPVRQRQSGRLSRHLPGGRQHVRADRLCHPRSKEQHDYRRLRPLSRIF